MALSTLIARPCNALNGEISPPGDKSIAHRTLMLSALAQGQSSINNLPDSRDINSTINVLTQLGVSVEMNHAATIHGVGLDGLCPPDMALDCGNSGTTMRLITGILAAQKFDCILTGDHSLLNRPMERVAEPLRSMGACLGTNHKGRPPINIYPVTRLNERTVHMAIPSAQVKTALIFTGICANLKTTVTEAIPTRDHTENLLTLYQVPFDRYKQQISLKGCRQISPCQLTLPGDFSSAMFFITAATLIPGSKIRLSDINLNPLRIKALHILRAMGADITIHEQGIRCNEPFGTIEVRYAPLTGITVPAEAIPAIIDEIPVLAVAAAQAKGQTTFSGVSELRYKESDRLQAIDSFLNQLGAYSRIDNNNLLIEHSPIIGGRVDSKADHRLAMACAVAGSIAKRPVQIDNANFDISYPKFIIDANKLNMEVNCEPAYSSSYHNN